MFSLLTFQTQLHSPGSTASCLQKLLRMIWTVWIARYGTAGRDFLEGHGGLPSARENRQEGKTLLNRRTRHLSLKWRKEEWPDKITWDSFLLLVGCQGSHCAKSVKICCSTCRNAWDSDKDTWHQSCFLITLLQVLPGFCFLTKFVASRVMGSVSCLLLIPRPFVLSPNRTSPWSLFCMVLGCGCSECLKSFAKQESWLVISCRFVRSFSPGLPSTTSSMQPSPHYWLLGPSLIHSGGGKTKMSLHW